MKRSYLTGSCLAVLASCAVLGFQAAPAAAASTAADHAYLPFADVGNIRGWAPDGKNAIYIENLGRKWYHASFFTPCNSLPYALTVAFVTEPNGSIDKFSSILVDGERCWFKTFNESGKPNHDKDEHVIAEPVDED